ncbi:MAG: OsmC family protein [Desulfovibrio sp.]|nr:OsmC family protein [Desulfovibrio sp.]
MTEQTRQSTTVHLERRGPLIDLDAESRVLPALSIDNNSLPENERGGTAKKLLGSSVLYCYVAALDKALATRGIVYDHIEAHAEVVAGSDDKGRSRIVGITLTVLVHADEEYEELFERVCKVMRQGCLISASLEAAFPVTYDLKLVCPDD